MKWDVIMNNNTVDIEGTLFLLVARSELLMVCKRPIYVKKKGPLNMHFW